MTFEYLLTLISGLQATVGVNFTDTNFVELLYVKGYNPRLTFEKKTFVNIAEVDQYINDLTQEAKPFAGVRPTWVIFADIQLDMQTSLTRQQIYTTLGRDCNKIVGITKLSVSIEDGCDKMSLTITGVDDNSRLATFLWLTTFAQNSEIYGCTPYMSLKSKSL